MSAIRDYLEAKAADRPNEWLRRFPRDTHPEILALVRAFEERGGMFNDDAERYVEDAVGDLPAHRHHGDPDRRSLTNQLGHEVYLARGILKDERAQDAIRASFLRGFVMLASMKVEDGERYTVQFGKLYVGQSIPVFGEEHQVRAKLYAENTMIFLPKGARTNGYLVGSTPTLIKKGWA